MFLDLQVGFLDQGESFLRVWKLVWWQTSNRIQVISLSVFLAQSPIESVGPVQTETRSLDLKLVSISLLWWTKRNVTIFSILCKTQRSTTIICFAQFLQRKITTVSLKRFQSSHAQSYNSWKGWKRHFWIISGLRDGIIITVSSRSTAKA